MATVVLAIILASATNLFVVGRRYIQHNRSRMIGSELGRFFLDPLHLNVTQAEWGDNCLSGNLTDCPRSQRLDNIYNATYTFSNVTDTDLRRVTVDIKWNEIQP